MGDLVAIAVTLDNLWWKGLVHSYGGYRRVLMPRGMICGRGSASGQVLKRFLVRQNERRTFNLQ